MVLSLVSTDPNFGRHATGALIVGGSQKKLSEMIAINTRVNVNFILNCFMRFKAALLSK